VDIQNIHPDMSPLLKRVGPDEDKIGGEEALGIAVGPNRRGVKKIPQKNLDGQNGDSPVNEVRNDFPRPFTESIYSANE
jgi:hypothetical protein